MYKEKLKTGDILHCTGSSLLSKLIRKFTKSRYSHTAIVIECWGQPYVVGAQKNGVNVRHYEEWLKEYKYDFIVSRPIFSFKPHQLSIKSFSKVGVTRYDFASLLWYQPKYIITGKWKGKNKPDADKRMYCSEYVAWIYDLPSWWKLSPNEVYQYCINNKSKYKTE